MDDELPFVRRRLEWGYMGPNTVKRYFYILGGGGRAVKDSRDKEHFVEGYYLAIDNNGHTRLCHYSNVVVPVIPPHQADRYQLEVIEYEQD